MIIVLLIAAAIALYFMTKWLFTTSVAMTPQRVIVALSADFMLMFIIGIFLYAIGMRVVFQ